MGGRTQEVESRTPDTDRRTSGGPGAAGIRGRTAPLSVAPMMDRTDRHFRRFMRSISRSVLLYTEMVTTGALLHGDVQRHLAFDPVERPVALQLGGDDPNALATCARLGDDFGYDEINLNVGCPSDRVQRGSFGACLMAEPHKVADGVAAMRAVTDLPVTVKHRIGIDQLDSYEHMAAFVETVAAAGCDRFTVHARIAWLQGLSPKENRDVPPLRYDDVYRLKRDYPELPIEINGGIRTLAATMEHLQRVDAVMIGRAAVDDPYLFALADSVVFGAAAAPPTRRQVLQDLLPYADAMQRDGVPVTRLTRHLLNLTAHRPGARAFRRLLSEEAHRCDDAVDLLRRATAVIPDDVLDERPNLQRAA